MKYAADMGSGAKFHKDWFRHSEVDNGGHRMAIAWIVMCRPRVGGTVTLFIGHLAS
jgi:hypothetical protein